MDRRNVLKESLINFLRVMGDLMVLNWLWVICSLPVVTLGPASCALYAVTLRLCRGENCAPVRDFFRAFKVNFKPGLILGLLVIVLAVIGVGDALFAMEQGVDPTPVIRGIVAGLKFDRAEDATAPEVQAALREQGIDYVIEKYMGLAKDEPLFGMIKAAYEA